MRLGPGGYSLLFSLLVSFSLTLSLRQSITDNRVRTIRRRMDVQPGALPPFYVIITVCEHNNGHWIMRVYDDHTRLRNIKICYTLYYNTRYYCRWPLNGGLPYNPVGGERFISSKRKINRNHSKGQRSRVNRTGPYAIFVYYFPPYGSGLFYRYTMYGLQSTNNKTTYTL